MSDSNWIGKQLGNYQLMKLLGAGGFAEVYLGEHVHLGTQAAIKVLHTQLGDEDVDHFRTEARTVARLMHPNIVRVLDFGVEGRTPYLVMDFAPKGTLRQQHIKGQPLPVATVISYVRQVADALQCAHDEKLIHRDVKPENMLVGRRNEILLSDFGIALVAQSSRYQSTKDMAGTMAYMAPEQIQGKPRPASDQYALGIVVYEWLTGERPFHGSFTEIVAQHIAVPPPPLRQKVPTIHEDIERVIMIALEKDYQKRFDTIHAFANALEQANQDNIATVASSHIPSALPPTVYVVNPKPAEVSGLSASNAALKEKKNIKPVGKVMCEYTGYSGGVYGLTWSPDGSRIASGGADRIIRIWNALSGQTTTIYRNHSNRINVVAWSPDGQKIASGSYDQTLQIWDANSGNMRFAFPNQDMGVTDLCWSPDGKLLASSTETKEVKIWEMVRGQAIRIYRKHTTPVSAIAWSPDGQGFVSAGRDRGIYVWNSEAGGLSLMYAGHLVQQQQQHIHTLRWLDKSCVISGDAQGMVKVWIAASGRTIATYRGHSGPICAVTSSPDAKFVASASIDGTVQVWSVMTEKPVFTYRHNAPVYTVAWSPDGKYIASGGDDKKVTVWLAP